MIPFLNSHSLIYHNLLVKTNAFYKKLYFKLIKNTENQKDLPQSKKERKGKSKKYYSKKSFNCFEREGWRNLRKAFASI